MASPPHYRLLPAVSPAVVVGAMFDLKQAGYGVAKNIPVIVVAAASFDDVVGTLEKGDLLCWLHARVWM